VPARRSEAWTILTAALALAALAAPARAGPPYVTDDAEPTDQGHWEIYNFASAVHTPGDTETETGVDLNYGGAKDLQLTMTVPVELQNGAHAGLGDIELAGKYKFIHQSKDSWLPDVAVFPRLFTPTAGSRYGTGRLGLLLPVWAEKDWGGWSLFGGGGFQINPGPGQRNFWQTGLVLTRAVNERLTVGAEVYHQTPDAVDAKAFTGLNVGATYVLTKHWSLLASGGPGVENARDQGQYAFYLALEATY
jgi:hypothetical protein